MAQTFNYPLNLASSVASTVSSIFIPTNATIGNVLYNTLTVGNMLSNNLNLGSVSMFSGSFSASNNQVSAANVTGLIFSNSNVNYFEIILTVGITTSIPSTINAVYTIRGNYNASGWALAVSYIGDTTGITFSINSVTGQISYTSTNISFWTSDIFRYRVEQITSTGTYTSLIAGATTSNYSFSTLQILSTTDALPNNNIGALQVAGGVTISKELFVGGSSFFNTTGSLGINTTNISYNLDVNGTLRVNNTLLATFNSNTIGNIFTTGGNVGINTISPGFTLDVNGSTRITNTNASSMGTLIVAGPSTNSSYTPANTTSGQLMSVYGAGGGGGYSNIDLSTFLTSSSFNYLPTARISMFDLGVGNCTFNILTKNTIALGSMVSRIFIDGSGNVGINTTSPGFTLDVSGTGRFTSSITTSNVFSTNITSTNLVSSFTSLGNLTSSTGTFANKVGGSQTVGTIVVTTSASLIGNTNTIGNLFTTGGNVGINTVSPIYTLDVNGTSRISTKLDIGGTQPNFNNSTLGTLFLTGSGVSGILMNTTQDIYPTYQLGNLGHDNIVQYFDMYYDGNANRASSSTGSFIISKNLNRLNFITFASGSAGSILASQNYSMVIGSTGNVGINQTSPAFTLDVSGSTRITNSLLATFNSNTLGSLFTSGGNVSITGNLSATGLNTSSFSPAHTFINTGTNFPTALAALTPNIPSGSSNTFFVGQSLSIGNAAQLAFNYNGNNSTSNSVQLSCFGGGSSIQLLNNGNVGINTATPAFTLDVVSAVSTDSARIYNTNPNGFGTIVFQNNSGTTAIMGIGGSTTPSVYANKFYFIGPSATFQQNIASTSTGTGSIVVTGGVGISGNTNIGGTVQSSNTKFNYNASASTQYTGTSELTGYNTALISSSNFSNGRFTATITGNYFVSVSVYIAANTGTGRWNIRKNGSINYTFIESSSSAANEFKFATTVVNLNVGDYVSAWWLTGTLYTDGNTYFSGFLIT